jgi:hypothetical protein
MIRYAYHWTNRHKQNVSAAHSQQHMLNLKRVWVGSD